MSRFSLLEDEKEVLKRAFGSMRPVVDEESWFLQIQGDGIRPSKVTSVYAVLKALPPTIIEMPKGDYESRTLYLQFTTISQFGNEMLQDVFLVRNGEFEQSWSRSVKTPSDPASDIEAKVTRHAVSPHDRISVAFPSKSVVEHLASYIDRISQHLGFGPTERAEALRRQFEERDRGGLS